MYISSIVSNHIEGKNGLSVVVQLLESYVLLPLGDVLSRLGHLVLAYVLVVVIQRKIRRRTPSTTGSKQGRVQREG